MFHMLCEAFVNRAGGVFQPGPLKLIERVSAKVENDYEGNFCLVADIVRATAVFETITSLATALMMLLDRSVGATVGLGLGQKSGLGPAH